MSLDREQLALVVHDLKNPLAALLSNLGFVLSAVRSDAMTAEAVEDCLLSTEVLSRLIENLAVVGQFDERPGVLDAAVQLGDVFQSVASRMKPHLETSGLSWHFDCPSELPSVQGHDAMLELALDNLISASMVYAPAGSMVSVTARAEAPGVVVTITDEGPAVDAELRQQVFTKAGQGACKTVRGGRYGRGLGLFVVGLIVSRCGGTLELDEVDSRYCCRLRLVAR